MISFQKIRQIPKRILWGIVLCISILLLVLSFTVLNNQVSGIIFSIITFLSAGALALSFEPFKRVMGIKIKQRSRFDMFSLLDKYLSKMSKKGGAACPSDVFKDIDDIPIDALCKDQSMTKAMSLKLHPDKNLDCKNDSTRKFQLASNRCLTNKPSRAEAQFDIESESTIKNEKVIQLQKLLDAIKSSNSNVNDGRLESNIAVINTFPFVLSNIREASKLITKKGFDDLNVLNTINKQIDEQYYLLTLKSNRKNNPDNLNPRDVLKDPSMFNDDKTPQLTTLKKIDVVQRSNTKYNTDERNYITSMLLANSSDYPLSYDVFKCDKNIVSMVINDFEHKDYLRMLVEFKSLYFLRLLYLLLNHLEFNNPLDAHDNRKDILTDADSNLINLLKRIANGEMDNTKFNGADLSGIVKYKLWQSREVLKQLIKHSKNNNLYIHLLNVGECFISLYKALQTTNTEYSLYIIDSEYRVDYNSTDALYIDGADDVNQFVSLDGKMKLEKRAVSEDSNLNCESKSIALNGINTTEWCSDNFKGYNALNAKNNSDCETRANTLLNDVNNVCKDLKSFNKQRYNNVFYFNDSVSYDAEFKRYLQSKSIDMSMDLTITTLRYDSDEDIMKYDTRLTYLFNNDMLGSSLVKLISNLSQVNVPKPDMNPGFGFDPSKTDTSGIAVGTKMNSYYK